MRKELVEQALEEARREEANLVIWDRRDTFTVESDDLSNLKLADEYLQVSMEDGKATVYVELEEVYKLVVEKERAGRRTGTRAGFGSALD